MWKKNKTITGGVIFEKNGIVGRPKLILKDVTIRQNLETESKSSFMIDPITKNLIRLTVCGGTGGFSSFSKLHEWMKNKILDIHKLVLVGRADNSKNGYSQFYNAN